MNYSAQAVYFTALNLALSSNIISRPGMFIFGSGPAHFPTGILDLAQSILLILHYVDFNNSRFDHYGTN